MLLPAGNTFLPTLAISNQPSHQRRGAPHRRQYCQAAVAIARAAAEKRDAARLQLHTSGQSAFWNPGVDMAPPFPDYEDPAGGL